MIYIKLKIQLYQELLDINKYLSLIDIGEINYTTFSGLGILITEKSKPKKVNHILWK